MEMDTTVDGGGHLLRTTTLLCRGMCKKLSFLLICLARPKSLDGPRTTMNGLVPFRSVPQDRIELRHARLRKQFAERLAQ